MFRTTIRFVVEADYAFRATLHDCILVFIGFESIGLRASPSTFSRVPFRVRRRAALSFRLTSFVKKSIARAPLNPTIACNRGLRANPVRFLVCMYVVVVTVHI